jgi:hypothetical protein
MLSGVDTKVSRKPHDGCRLSIRRHERRSQKRQPDHRAAMYHREMRKRCRCALLTNNTFDAKLAETGESSLDQSALFREIRDSDVVSSLAHYGQLCRRIRSMSSASRETM